MNKRSIFGKYFLLTLLAAAIALIAFISIFLVDFNIKNQRLGSLNVGGSGSYVCHMGFRNGYDYRCNFGGLLYKMGEEFIMFVVAVPFLLFIFGRFTVLFLLLATAIIFVWFRNETKWHVFKVPKKRFFIAIVALIFLLPTLLVVIVP
jgi:hypothetical protein